jgi:outer membrane receptor protein involved in Fe transport
MKRISTAIGNSRAARGLMLCGSILAIAAYPQGAAIAQTIDQANSEATTSAVDTDGTGTDIIVTAERRATSLQRTALSIVAYNQDAVEAKGSRSP